MPEDDRIDFLSGDGMGSRIQCMVGQNFQYEASSSVALIRASLSDSK